MTVFRDFCGGKHGLVFWGIVLFAEMALRSFAILSGFFTVYPFDSYTVNVEVVLVFLVQSRCFRSFFCFERF